MTPLPHATQPLGELRTELLARKTRSYGSAGRTDLEQATLDDVRAVLSAAGYAIVDAERERCAAEDVARVTELQKRAETAERELALQKYRDLDALKSKLIAAEKRAQEAERQLIAWRSATNTATQQTIDALRTSLAEVERERDALRADRDDQKTRVLGLMNECDALRAKCEAWRPTVAFACHWANNGQEWCYGSIQRAARAIPAQYRPQKDEVHP